MPILHCGSQKFSHLEAVIFDKDGTLEDSWAYLHTLTQFRLSSLEALCPQSTAPLALALGYQKGILDPAGLMAVGSRLECEIASAVVLAQRGYCWFEALELARQSFEDADAQMARQGQTGTLFPGVKELSATLHQGGLKLAVLSAARTAVVTTFVEHQGLLPYFQVLMGSDQGLSKPDPALYLRTCELLAVDPVHTLMVGDAQGDITMAQKAGAKTAAISWPQRPAVSLKGMDVVVTALSQIRLG